MFSEREKIDSYFEAPHHWAEIMHYPRHRVKIKLRVPIFGCNNFLGVFLSNVKSKTQNFRYYFYFCILASI